MTERLQLYKCELCGNIAEVIFEAAGTLSCCGESMVLQEENTVDAAKEKHVPVIEKIDGGYKVSVGATLHPMAEDHWIVFIELIADGMIMRHYLLPGHTPSVTFMTSAASVTAREYCNKHGFWKSKN